MSQEKKNCKKCGMLFNPSPNNPEYCPEHQRKRNSIWSYIKTGGIVVGGVVAWIFISRFRDDDPI